MTFPGIDPPPKEQNPARLDGMHRRYGKAEGHTCADCIRLVPHIAGKHTVYKCAGSHVSSSAATDWRKKWQACGLWQKHPAH